MASSGSPPNLNLIPAGMPPPGVDPFPLFKGPSLAPVTTVLFAILVPLSFVTVVIRLLASYKARGESRVWITAADIASVSALIILIGQESVVLSLRNTERHQWDVSVATFDASYAKRVYAQDILSWPGICLSKLAILLLYLRLFKIQPAMRYAIYAGIVWTCITYLPSIAVVSFYCAPHYGDAWGLSTAETCGNHNALRWYIASSVLSIILDLYIFALPIKVVSSLNMSKSRRIGVLLIFFTALFACVCAVLQLIYRIRILKTTDDLWLSGQLFITNLVETTVAIIVGALPGCSSYFKSHFPETLFYTRVFSKISTSFSRSTAGSSNKSSQNDRYNSIHPSKFGNSSTADTDSQRSLYKNSHSMETIKVQTEYSVRGAGQV